MTDYADAPVTPVEIVGMERSAMDLSWIGAMLMLEAAVVMVVVLHHFGEITDHYVDLLTTENPHATETLVLLVVRTAAYGTVTATAIYALIRFAGACFDQATRFRKRAHSAHVLNFVLRTYDSKIQSERITINSALKVFKAWNANVESAFSGIKLVRDKQESVAGSTSPTGATNFIYGESPRISSSR